MSTVDEILEILKEDKRHRLVEIAKRLKLTKRKTAEILQFLTECNFVTFDPKTNIVKIDPELKELILLEETEKTATGRRTETEKATNPTPREERRKRPNPSISLRGTS